MTGYSAEKPDNGSESVVVYFAEGSKTQIISIRSPHGKKVSLPKGTVLVPFAGSFMVTHEYADCLKIATSPEPKGMIHLPNGFDHNVFMHA